MATQLTPHFTLEEMCFSYTAVRKSIPNVPHPDEQAALKKLCEMILEPLREQWGAIHINSGYRSPAVNKAVGGAKSSQHMYGQAADITVTTFKPIDLCKQIILMKLPFDQLIYEFGPGGWVHVSYCEGQHYKRGEVLTAKKINGKTKYLTGLVK